MAKLAGHQIKELTEAILDCYRYDALMRAIRIYCNERLPEISRADNYEMIVFETVDWFDERDRHGELIGALAGDRPNNIVLQRFAAQFTVTTTAPRRYQAPSRAEVRARRKIMMNRHNEVAQFRQIMRGERAERIVLVEGGPKMGKSRLLQEYQQIAQTEANARCAHVDLRTQNHDYRHILWTLAQQLGAYQFRQLEVAQDAIDRTRPAATPVEDIATALMTLLAQQRADESVTTRQRQRITRAFVDDLQQQVLQGRVVLLVDAFEQSLDKTIYQWVYRELLLGLSARPNVVIVLAGRRFDTAELAWQADYLNQVLQAVKEQDYLTYSQEVGATQLTREKIQVLYQAFNGVPGKFVEVVPQFLGAAGAV
ncbi:MAG: effector-associated domain EAD1-containing protein [Candidatus Promineifilaceae bacterium]